MSRRGLGEEYDQGIYWWEEEAVWDPSCLDAVALYSTMAKASHFKGEGMRMANATFKPRLWHNICDEKA